MASPLGAVAFLAALHFPAHETNVCVYGFPLYDQSVELHEPQPYIPPCIAIDEGLCLKTKGDSE